MVYIKDIDEDLRESRYEKIIPIPSFHKSVIGGK